MNLKQLARIVSDSTGIGMFSAISLIEKITGARFIIERKLISSMILQGMVTNSKYHPSEMSESQELFMVKRSIRLADYLLEELNEEEIETEEKSKD